MRLDSTTTWRLREQFYSVYRNAGPETPESRVERAPRS